MLLDPSSRHESTVRVYGGRMPAVLATAGGSWIEDVDGQRFIDFLSGAGALNYGHNDPAIIGEVLAYMQRGGIVHSLGLHTQAKADFIASFQTCILRPRNLSFKLQFAGPTGANAVAAALKLARKVTGRDNIVGFTNGHHGLSLRGPSATAHGASVMPYDGFLGENVDTLNIITGMLTRAGSGVDPPAAILVETVQGEGGLDAASGRWMRGLARLAARIGALLVIDDRQAGVGRTGSFFSFEPFNIHPDLVILSKSLSGFGAPLSIVLLRPEIDLGDSGEPTGCFRGNDLAFVGATAAIKAYWRDERFGARLAERIAHLRRRLEWMIRDLGRGMVSLKGRGMMSGLAFDGQPKAARVIADMLYAERMIIETRGEHDHVLKLWPPLNISQADLDHGLDLIEAAMTRALWPERRRQGSG